MPEFSCDEHAPDLCSCDLRVGQLQLRQGLLCRLNDRGRLHCGAPRRGDVAMAQRILASIEDTPLGTALPADIIGVYEKP